MLVELQRARELDVGLGGWLVGHDLGADHELAVRAVAGRQPCELAMDLGGPPGARQDVRDPPPGRQEVVMRAHQRHRRALLIDQLRDRLLAIDLERDVAIDEPGQGQRERGGLEERDRLGARRVRPVLGHGELVGKPEHLVELGQVRRAVGGLGLGEQDQGLHRGLERARLREHGPQAMQEPCVAREPAADLGRIGLPHPGQLIEQGGRHERLIVVDRVGDPAGDCRPDPVAHAIALGARRHHPELVDRLVTIRVVAQLDLHVGPGGVKADLRAAPDGERGGERDGERDGDRRGDRDDMTSRHCEQPTIVVTLR